MGQVQYDWLEGIQRVMRACEKLDPRWVEIIAYHAALENELDEMLVRSLPQGEFVTGNSPRFTFGHKIAILKAAWRGKPEDIEKLATILFWFNELRNAVAHPDKKATRTRLRRLSEAYADLAPGLDHHADIAEIAQGVCAFMGDGILPHDLVNLAEKLDHLVNVQIPEALAKPDRKMAAPER